MDYDYKELLIELLEQMDRRKLKLVYLYAKALLGLG